MKQACREGWLCFSVSLVGERIIDDRGIVPAIRQGVRMSLSRLLCPKDQTSILLDGGLRAPRTYPIQRTIIKGDEKENIIALASIAAKVLRDKAMERHAKRYPQYGFSSHKGYGTKQHYAMLRRHGTCPIHRKSFLRGFTA